MIPFLDLQKVNAAHEPQLSEAIARVVASGRYLQGQEVQAFEQAFAKFLDIPHCVGVGNGLDALTLSLTALKQWRHWEDGDEVILPAMTFVATAEAVCRARLRPVLCDVGSDFLIDPRQVTPHLTSRTRALLPVHLYGKLCDMQALLQLASAHGLAIVEDAAQAHGAHDAAGRMAGTFGDAAAFSFYPGKNLGALSDGGAVTTPHPEVAERVRCLANYGASQKYHHSHHGLNSRLDEIQAAALRVKLPRLQEENAHRQLIAGIYSQNLRHPLVTVPYEGDTSQSIFHIYPLRTAHRTELARFLADKGVCTLIHYPKAIHQQKAFREWAEECHPMAEAIANECLSLPVSPVQTPEDTHRIVDLIHQFTP